MVVFYLVQKIGYELRQKPKNIAFLVPLINGVIMSQCLKAILLPADIISRERYLGKNLNKAKPVLMTVIGSRELMSFHLYNCFKKYLTTRRGKGKFKLVVFLIIWVLRLGGPRARVLWSAIDGIVSRLILDCKSFSVLS